MARDTTTGDNFERITKLCIERSCQANGIDVNGQKFVGGKPGGGRHKIDYELVLKSNEDIRGLVSCKKQGVGGTAQEKVAYEVIKLLHAMSEDQRYRKAWLILGGNGWSPDIREFLRTEIQKWVPALNEGRLKIIFSTDELMATDFSLLD